MSAPVAVPQHSEPPVPAIVRDVLRSPGKPLEAGVRSSMEPRLGRHFPSPGSPVAPHLALSSLGLGRPGDRWEQEAESVALSIAAAPGARGPGYDFSTVRIHTGPEAADSARAIQARAYTAGHHVVFGENEYRPGTPGGDRLLAHELAHVIQQSRYAPGNLIQRELAYASAYPRPYTSDAAETRSAEAKTWFPASIDFTATATGSGGGQACGTFDDLLKFIKGTAVGSIKELGIIGHSNQVNFGLSGTVKVSPPDVTFTDPGLINSTTIAAKASEISPLRDRFAKDAKIILYGCHAGIGDGLMSALSSAFGVCVKGFSQEVLWCITWDTATRAIKTRGGVYVDDAGLWASGLLGCESFYTNVTSLKPDKESCSGVPGAAKKTAAAGGETEETVAESAPAGGETSEVEAA